MCARFRSVRELSQLPGFFKVGAPINFAFNPNVAPSDPTITFMVEKGLPDAVRLAEFGIVLPSRSKHQRMYNTRTDTLKKGSFRSTLKTRRCVVPAEGFYEWRDEDGKQPYMFSRKDAEPILFAALWMLSEVDGQAVPSFSILTAEPTPFIAQFHDRMPVILNDPSSWLDLNTGIDDLDYLPDCAFIVVPKNRALNSSRQKDAAKIDAPVEQKQIGLFS